MAVTRDVVEHTARLARLALDESRVKELVAELNGILGHMEVLQDADTKGVDATAGIGDAALPLREDGCSQIELSRPRDSFAPAMRDGFFLVPRLSTHEALGELPEDE